MRSEVARACHPPATGVLLFCLAACATTPPPTGLPDRTPAALASLSLVGLPSLTSQRLTDEWPWKLVRRQEVAVPLPRECGSAFSLTSEGQGTTMVFRFLPVRYKAGSCLEALHSTQVWSPGADYEAVRSKALEYFRSLLPRDEFDKLLTSNSAMPNWKRPTEFLWTWGFGDVVFSTETLQADLEEVKGRWNFSLWIGTARSAPIPPPTLLDPGDLTEPGHKVPTTTPTFTWSEVEDAYEYGLYVAEFDGSRYSLIFDSTVNGPRIVGTSYTIPSGYLKVGGHYCWNMNSQGYFGFGTAFAPPRYFGVQQ